MLIQTPVYVFINEANNDIFYSYRGILNAIVKSTDLYDITKFGKLHKKYVISCDYHKKYIIQVIHNDNLAKLVESVRAKEMMFHGKMLRDDWLRMKEQSRTLAACS